MPWRLGVKKSKRNPSLLADSVYDDQVERLTGLSKFPAMPKARQELIHALRRISDTDADFLHRLISDVVDTHSICPTPADLIRMAGEKRQRVRTSVGKSDCPYCEGTGFVITYRTVSPVGLPPYEASGAARCQCRM
jgi:hypothetical protein